MLIPTTNASGCACKLAVQVLHRDLNKGNFAAGSIVCLVIDECHRAVGNSDAVAAVKLIAAAPGGAARIIGLSATPGSQPEKIQEVINNMRASRICFLSDDDPQVAEYRHGRQEEVLVVQQADDLAECSRLAEQLLYKALVRLTQQGLFNHCNTSAVTPYQLQQARESIGLSAQPGGCFPAADCMWRHARSFRPVSKGLLLQACACPLLT